LDDRHGLPDAVRYAYYFGGGGNSAQSFIENGVRVGLRGLGRKRRSRHAAFL